jgi:hypothetical protein
MRMPKQFIVEWVNANGQWLLEDVSSRAVAFSR